MEEAETHLENAGRVVAALRDLGYEPILVGGMALVVLGSRRVTRDFDFVIAGPGAQLPRLIDVFYDRDLELASRVNGAGDVIAFTCRGAGRRLEPAPGADRALGVP